MRILNKKLLVIIRTPSNHNTPQVFAQNNHQKFVKKSVDGDFFRVKLSFHFLSKCV